MKKYFITSSGTDIGKTFASCSIACNLKKSGKNPLILKPIISGWQKPFETTDTAQILDALELDFTEENIDKISAFKFKEPLSPDMASKLENTEISFEKLIDFCQQDFDCDYLLIEGVGGVMVPINSQYTVLDWIKELNIEVILVVGSYLGSISHTLTAIKSLQTENIKIHKIIISESQNSVCLKSTKETLQNFTDAKIEIQELIKDTDQAWKHSGLTIF